MQYKSSMGALCVNMCIAGALARAGGKVKYYKQYNEDNLDTIRKQQKQYQQKHATKIAARNKVKHNCSVCAGRYTHVNRARHFRSPKHQDAMCINTQASAHHDS